jgi:hypothetical protein
LHFVLLVIESGPNRRGAALLRGIGKTRATP